MIVTYSKYYAKFVIPTLLTEKPIVVSIRKKKAQVEAARARLVEEFNRLERQIWEEELGASAIFDELTRRTRHSFKRILNGYTLVDRPEVTIWKTATRLNEKGENDYRVVSEERISHLEWRK